MPRILLLFAFFAAVSTEDANQQFMKCSQLINPATLSCCLSRNLNQYMHVGDVRECFKLPHSLNSCMPDKCVAIKMGIASSEGTIDKNELKKHVEENFQDDIELKNLIIDTCVDGDLDKFGTEDACELKKIRLCVELQLFSLCSKWDTKGLCAGFKDLASECLEVYT